MKLQPVTWALYVGVVSALTACSGTPIPSGASAGATSSGVITAFGSVFVNDHEFYTGGVTVVDDDTGDTTDSTADLEAGEVVDVDTASNSGAANPVAAELHIHPLARGYVDASDTTGDTLMVMGQTIQVTSDTTFSDHRACVSASSSPCAAITDQSGLTATTGSGAHAVPGSFVTVHGFLFAADATSGTANIVATLVSVADAPTGSAGDNFKAEGVVTTTGSSSVTIGGLTVDLTGAQCQLSGQPTDCAGAFTMGQVVSAYAPTAPALPAMTFAAAGARQSTRIPANAAGSTVEFEGAVSSVTDSPAAFVIREVNIDASALPAGTALPAVGDIVRVVGTVTADGQSVTAAAVTELHVARNAAYEFEGEAQGVAAGTAPNTFVLTLLDQTITITADTRLADRSTRFWYGQDPATNPFNITTFAAYLAGSASQQLVVSAATDAGGNLTAGCLTIVPTSTTSGVAGVVDASPAPFNSSGSGTPTTFAVHGLPVSADPTIVVRTRTGFASTVAAGDQVIALGTFAGGTLTVDAPLTLTNGVIDWGVPARQDMAQF